ncbi:MAG: hypothetical protein MK102_05485 [Fuerstiella sp.]|nr:hypothetical protein [Fuerstiella sp.]
MTIRYECPECSSVLKIKVEKVGRPAKCPKCMSEFTVPETSQRVKPLLTEDDLVDMPLEITPVAVAADTSIGSSTKFDPTDILNSDAASGRKESTEAENKAKPSVAELMKEHQEKLARRESRRSKPPEKKINPLLSGIETTGTAADAITRSYEKKREDSDVPILNRDERRAAAARAALIRFILQLGGVLTATVMFGFLLFSYVLSSQGANLVEVTGKVTVGGEPMDGYLIRFIPIQERGGPALEGGPSSAVIRNNGEFRLQYSPTVAGAIVAEHEVSIEDEFGLPQPIPEEFTRRKVSKDVENHFEFNF